EFVANLALNASVLRDALLHDGHVGLNLEPLEDGCLKALGRALHLLHDTVNAVADAKLLGQRLEVNVRSAQLERVEDQLIHQFDHGRVSVHFPAVISAEDGNGHFGFRQLLDRIPHAIVLRLGNLFAAVILIEGVLDVFLAGDLQFDVRVEEVVQAVDRVEIGRIADGHSDGAADLGNGNGAVFLGDVAADDVDDVIAELEFAEIDDFSAEVRGFGLGNVSLADVFVGDEEVDDSDTGCTGLPAGRFHLFGGDEAEVHQNIDQIIVFLSHVNLSATLPVLEISHTLASTRAMSNADACPSQF